MPPLAPTQETIIMAEMDDFAERLSTRLLDQLRTDHEEAASRNAEFREAIRQEVAAIREIIAAMVAREEASKARIAALESQAAGATRGIIGLLIGFLGSAGAAIWGLLRDK
jgi:hypothetical protein